MFACAKYKLHHFVPPNAARSKYFCSSPSHSICKWNHYRYYPWSLKQSYTNLFYDWIFKNLKIALICIVKTLHILLYYHKKILSYFIVKCALVNCGSWDFREREREHIKKKIKLTFPPLNYEIFECQLDFFEITKS